MSGPKYQNAMDVIKAKITPGDVGTGITLRQIRGLTGATESTARKAANELVAEGILENHPGAPYTIIATAGDAAARRPGGSAVQAQIAALRNDAADLRQRVGRIEASLADLRAKVGRGNSRGGKRDQAEAPADSGQR